MHVQILPSFDRVIIIDGEPVGLIRIPHYNIREWLQINTMSYLVRDTLIKRGEIVQRLFTFPICSTISSLAVEPATRAAKAASKKKTRWPAIAVCSTQLFPAKPRASIIARGGEQLTPTNRNTHAWPNQSNNTHSVYNLNQEEREIGRKGERVIYIIYLSDYKMMYMHKTQCYTMIDYSHNCWSVFSQNFLIVDCTGHKYATAIPGTLRPYVRGATSFHAPSSGSNFSTTSTVLTPL